MFDLIYTNKSNFYNEMKKKEKLRKSIYYMLIFFLSMCIKNH